eukprot:scaffold11704_cov72-Phaeocystis_antarctica.AAC.1
MRKRGAHRTPPAGRRSSARSKKDCSNASEASTRTEKAKQAKQHSHEEGPMATFQEHWIRPGAAVFTVHGPKVALLSHSPNKEPPLSGGVHLRTVAAVEPAAGQREKSAGWLWCRRVTSARTG